MSRRNGEPFAIVPKSVLAADVSHAAIRVYAALAVHANRDRVAFPSHALIAEEARMGERHVRRCLRELERAGIIESRQGQTTSRYNLVAGTPASDPPGPTEPTPPGPTEPPPPGPTEPPPGPTEPSGDRFPPGPTGPPPGSTGPPTGSTEPPNRQKNKTKEQIGEEEPEVSRPADRLSDTPGVPRDNAADELEGDAPPEESLTEKVPLPPVGAETAVPAEDGALCARCGRGSSAGRLWEAGGVPFHAEHLPAGVVVPAEPEPEPEPEPQPSKSPPKPPRPPRPPRAPSPPGAPPLADRLAAELARRPDGATVVELVEALDLDGGTVRTTLGRHPHRFAKDAAAPGAAVRWRVRSCPECGHPIAGAHRPDCPNVEEAAS